MKKTYRVTYSELDDALAAVGGVDGLLVGLPALAPGLPDEVLDAVEAGVEQQVAVDVRVTIGEVCLEVELRGGQS